MYVANAYGNNILKYDTAGNYLGGWGSYGSGSGQFSNPTDVDIDGSGNVYVTDNGNNRIQKFAANGAFLASWGILGSTTGAFFNPGYLALDASGTTERVIVGDTGNNRVQQFDLSGTFQSAFGQGGQPGGAFDDPHDIALDGAGNWYVTDAGLNRVQKFDQNGAYVSGWGAPGAGSGQFSSPRGVAFNPVENQVLIADFLNDRVQVFDQAGVFIYSFTVPRPFGMAVQVEAGQAYGFVTSTSEHKVRRYLLSSDSASLVNEWGGYGSGSGQFAYPYWVSADTSGNVYVSDQARVQKFTSAGVYLQVLTTTGTYPIARWAGGYLYLVGSSPWAIERRDADMALLATWGGSGILPGEFDQARGMAVDANGNLVVVDGENGRLQKFYGGYRLGSVLTGIEDAAGGMTHLGYRYENTMIQSLTDPQGHAANFVTTNRELTSSTDMAGVTSGYAYTGNHDLERLTVPSGDYLLTYNNNGLPSIDYQTPRAGEHYTLGEDSLINNYVTNALGQKTKYYFGSWSMTRYIEDPLNNQQLYLYDTHGNRTGITNTAGHTRSWTVDARGRTTSSTDELNHTTTWVFDDQNHTTTRTDPTPFNYQTLYAYDGNDNLLTVTDPENKTTTMTYYADGRLHTSTTALGKTTTYSYSGLVTTIVDPLGKTQSLTYDTLGRLVSRQDALGEITEYGYNNLGRRVWERHPDGTEKHWEYNCCGLEAEIDELHLDGVSGRRTEYERDELNRLTAVISRPESVHPALDRTLTTYGYDTAGRKTQMGDGLARATFYEYDAAGRLFKTTYPDANFEQQSWFPTGTLQSRTDRRGDVTTYAYDVAGRLTDTTYQDGSTKNASYDELGRLTLSTTKNPGGVIMTSLATTYTPTGRVETATQTLFGVTKALRYHYDDAGRLQWWRDESGTPYKVTTYTYYDNGWLWTITDPDGKVFTFEYNADGRLNKKSYANGTWAEYEYDAARGWLTALRHRKDSTASGIMAQFISKDGQGNPWYDAVGNRTAADVTGSQHHSYTYDAAKLDRLLTVDRPGSVNDEAYTYDEMGNRLTTRQYTNWSYNGQNDELVSWDGVTYTYDANGNRATRIDATGTSTYTYDFENRLIRVDRPGGAWTSYDYDALGRRVRKNDNGTVMLMWYDGEDMVVETDAAGTEQARYTHGPGIDAPLRVKRAGINSYYHEDPLGSIVLLTNGSKSATKTYKYDSFGNIISQTGTVVNPYQYTGREYDTETGLYYYRARTYDPKVGRFLQQDPLPPRWQEMNAYVYVGNSPIVNLDPSGLSAGGCVAMLLPSLSAPPGWVICAVLGTVLVGEVIYYHVTASTGDGRTPMPPPDLSGTPESCSLRFEICNSTCGALSGCEKAGCLVKCGIAFAMCLFGNL